MAVFGFARHRRLLAGCAALGLLVGHAVPAMAQSAAPAPAASGAPAPSSAAELKAAIDEIRQRLARQRETQPNAPTAGIAEELRAAGQRIASLTEAMEQLRSERDGVRQELVGAREQAEQLGLQLVELRRVARDAETAATTRQTALEGRVRDLEAERSQASARLAAIGSELEQARATEAATMQSLREIEQAKVALEASLRDEQAAKAAGEQALREMTAARDAMVQQARTADTAAGEAVAEREAKLTQAAGRIGELERALAEREASRLAAVDDAAKARAEAQRLTEAGRTTDEQARTVAAQLAEAQAQITAGTQAIEELRTANTRLEDGMRLARQESEEASRQRAQAMAADIEASRQRAQRLDTEIEALRAVATTSVSEVQSMGEQLIKALGENQELSAALAEMRGSKDVLDRELAAARRDGQSASAEAARLRGELTASLRKLAEAAAAPAEAAPQAALVKLQLSDEEAPAARSAAQTQVAELLAQVKAVETGDGWVMAIPEGLEFRPGSNQLDPATTQGLSRVAALIRGYGTPAVRVVGHTDSEGDGEENRALSLRRAQAVREFLVGRENIEPRLVVTEGYGEGRPVASNETPEGRRLNRRVEVYVKP